ncbi:MAG: TIGR01212 family radical SAM protein [Ruminococcaceae bacterium]|nr:TIGR01212 family radical SAM protein [Oscillospiraceae bacterium]
MKETQVTKNPYKNSDTNKRYYTYDYYLRKTFGGKCMKIPIDAGFTCPNIDGKCSTGGCIYCSPRGSGDFAAAASIPTDEQFEIVKSQLSSKWKTDKYIPYFQAHTNTYAPTAIIRDKIEPVMKKDGVVGLNIATRADCLEDETVEYLRELAERTTLTVELGLQSVHDVTADLINRGHTYADFVAGYEKLRLASEKINICIHVIFGLPGEDREMMLETVKQIAKLAPDQVKIHLLHVIRGTRLAHIYERGEYTPMTMEDYVDTVAEALTYLPPDTVIGRLTGDGMQSELLAPEWSRKKTVVINNIDKKMFSDNLVQGQNYKKTTC